MRFGRSCYITITIKADDIAYSIHDTEDFYRAGFIPLERLVSNVDGERERCLDKIKKRWEAQGDKQKELAQWDAHTRAFDRFLDWPPISEPYLGTRDQRWALRSFTSSRIARYLTAVELAESHTEPFRPNADHDQELTMLQELTWTYVINNPSLASQQYGHTRVIRELMTVYMDAANRSSPSWKIFPHRFYQELIDLDKDWVNDIPHDLRVRTAADTVASMTDLEALRVYQRFTGVLPGSVLEPGIR